MEKDRNMVENISKSKNEWRPGKLSSSPLGFISHGRREVVNFHTLLFLKMMLFIVIMSCNCHANYQSVEGRLLIGPFDHRVPVISVPKFRYFQVDVSDGLWNMSGEIQSVSMSGIWTKISFEISQPELTFSMKLPTWPNLVFRLKPSELAIGRYVAQLYLENDKRIGNVVLGESSYLVIARKS